MAEPRLRVPGHRMPASKARKADRNRGSTLTTESAVPDVPPIPTESFLSVVAVLASHGATDLIEMVTGKTAEELQEMRK